MDNWAQDGGRWRRNYRHAAVVAVTAMVCLGASIASRAAHAVQHKTGPAVPAPIRGKGYHLVKDWDFGEKIKTLQQMREEFFTRYVYNNGTCDTLTGNAEWEVYRDNDNHEIKGKTLRLIARAPMGLAKGTIESGMLRSRWTGKYGYYECRMKVPAGRGLWPAFWLNPHDEKWPPEIDILEIVDNGRDGTKNSFHYVHPGKSEESPEKTSRLDKWGSYRPGFDYADGFHTFAVEWTPDTVRHYVDGVLVVERTIHWRHDDGSDGGPADVLLNLAVGGTWPGPPTADTKFPAALDVDYIRVWQK